ncbi:HAMP domain-containing histidine kinase [Candidatus Saccharibacteria bacterium]|nr:HAMP domain-containing histidine kinase [Candidatus Saccharibacteria bacterium]
MSEVSNLSIVAHELKAPLSLIRQLTFSLDFASSASEQEKIKSEIVGVSERALRTVNDLTKIARLEDGLFELEPVSVRNVCSEVEEELKYLYRFSEKTLVTKFSNKSRLVIANRELLFSIIYNFASNALRYSAKNARSTLTLKDEKGKVKIEVRDFGPALPKTIYEKLKTNSLEAPTQISLRPDSSGLGLFIASKFARFMRADVGAVRHRDGTSFYISLPVSAQTSFFNES